MYDELFAKLETEYGLPAGILKGIAHVESTGNPNAKNPQPGSTASGMFQFTSATAAESKIDPFNVEQAAGATAKKLRANYDKFGSWDKAILAHNQGTAGVEKGRDNPSYIAKVNAAIPKVSGPPGKRVIRVAAEDVDTTAPVNPDAGKYNPVSGSDLENLRAGIGSGLVSSYRGTKQSALSAGEALDVSEKMGLPADSPAARFNAWVKGKSAENQAAIDEQARLDKPLLDTKAGLGGNIIGQVAPSMLIPGGGIGAGRTVGAAMLKGGGQGLGASMMGSRTSEEDPTTYAALSTLLGSGGSALLQQGGRAVNAARGKFRNFPVIGNQANPVEAYTAAKAAGIPVTIGDIDPTSKWHAWENFMRRIPLSGRAGTLKTQAGAVSDRLNAAKSDLTPPEIVAGEDPGKLLFDSIQREYKNRKDIVGHKFDAVENAAQQNGVDYITPSVTRDTADSIVNDFGDHLFDKFGDPRLVKSVKHVQNVMDPTKASEFGPTTFADMRKFRTLVGEKVRQMERMVKGGQASDGELSAVQRLYASINDDLNAWGTKNDQNQTVMELFKDASDAYRTKIDPFKRVPILNEVRLAAPDAPFDYDRLLRAVSSSDSPAKAASILNNADPSARKVITSHLVSGAVDKGLNPNREGSLSTKNFLDALDLGRTRREVFSPEDATTIGNLETSVRAARRSSDYITEPPSNSRMNAATLVGAATGLGTPALGAALAGPIGGAAGLGLLGAALGGAKASNAYTASNVGKRMFLADPQDFSDVTKTGSRAGLTAFEKLMQYLYAE